MTTIEAVYDMAATAGKPITAREVADRLGITRQHAIGDLRRLEKRGVLHSRPIDADGRPSWGFYPTGEKPEFRKTPDYSQWSGW